MFAGIVTDGEGRASFAKPSRARPSHAAVIYDRLRHEIVSMARLPGQPISDAQIALEHGVSRTPVREALLKLADEGLVDIFPQSGMRVARIPVAALPEAILIRKALEETTARLAAECANAAQISALRDLVKAHEQAMRAQDRHAFHEADEAFHATLAQMSGLSSVWSLIQTAKVQVDRYRRLTLPQPGRFRRVIAEHRRIVAAVAKRDGVAAAAAMGAHLDGLRHDISVTQARNPDYFDGVT